MKFISQRLWHNDKQTFAFVVGHGFKCWNLEDEPRKVKVKGETRVPALIYELGIRKEETTLTLKHRAAYNTDPNDIWFKYHIELLNVPKFIGVYIHSGIDETHTDACQLFSDQCDLTKDKNPMSYSLQAVKRFYKLVYPQLEKGIPCYLDIRDEIFPL